MSEMASHGGTIAAAFLCWIPLVSVVGGLVVAFFFTNMKAFAQNLHDGRREFTGGAYNGKYRGWRWS